MVLFYGLGSVVNKYPCMNISSSHLSFFIFKKVMFSYYTLGGYDCSNDPNNMLGQYVK